MEENAKGESRDEDEKEAVYRRGKTRIVEEGQGQEKACEETCQKTKKDSLHVCVAPNGWIFSQIETSLQVG